MAGFEEGTRFFPPSPPGSTLTIVFLIAAIPDPELHWVKPATRGSCAKQKAGGVVVKVLYIYSRMFFVGVVCIVLFSQYVPINHI